jgi:hypothetical protein
MTRRSASESRSASPCYSQSQQMGGHARAHRNRYRRTLGIVVRYLFKFALAIL